MTIPNEQFIEMWNDSNALDEIAVATGYTKQYASQRACDLRKQGIELKRLSKSKIGYLPTEDDIRRETALIRATWGPAETQRRVRADWRIQHVQYVEGGYEL